ncbi:MAG: hypothetical protein ACAH59_07450 [Pseudobdellovibrionaceae bacterium]
MSRQSIAGLLGIVLCLTDTNFARAENEDPQQMTEMFIGRSLFLKRTVSTDDWSAQIDGAKNNQKEESCHFIASKDIKAEKIELYAKGEIDQSQTSQDFTYAATIQMWNSSRPIEGKALHFQVAFLNGKAVQVNCFKVEKNKKGHIEMKPMSFSRAKQLLVNRGIEFKSESENRSSSKARGKKSPTAPAVQSPNTSGTP